MVSSFATKAARKATENRQDADYRASHINSSSEDKENQLDRVVESVANATKRLSQASTTTTNSSKRKSQNHVGPWRLGRTLGKGSTGRVRLAKHSITGQLAAVKIVPKLTPENVNNGNNKKQKNNIKIDKNGLPYGIEREIIIMKVISHPNIMALHDVWENKNELYLVLEYIEGGELFDYLVRKGKLEEREAATYFRQIISGLQYCHKFNICHRDLKPENLLLDKHRKIKIADFGMATLQTNTSLLETSCGSPHYASPEIVAGKNYHGGPSDIWSAGIILFALLTGRLPFDDPNIRELLLKVQTGRFRMPTSLSQEAKDLIWKMLRVDPRQRITIDEIFRHPFLLKYSSNKSAKNDFSKIDNLDLSPIHQYNDEILKNLQTLWHGIDLNTLKAKLSSPQKNSEKIFYQLLKNHLNDHNTKLNSPQSSKTQELRKPLPRSTSIVTTTISDANGENVKTITREVPNIPAPKPPASTSPISSARKPLGNVPSSALNSIPNKKTKTINGKKQGISASSSYRKPKSLKNHKQQNISRSSSKKSVRSQTSLKNSKAQIAHPPLPEARESRLNVMDFMYLCDEIFGVDDTREISEQELKIDVKARQEEKRKQAERKAVIDKVNNMEANRVRREQELALAEQKRKEQEEKVNLEESRQRKLLVQQQNRAREELKQLEAIKAKERNNFLSSYPKVKIANHNGSSLDPSRKIANDRKDNAKDVLNKFGVRLSRFGNLRDLDVKPEPLMLSKRSSLVESKSVSTRDLQSYLNDKSKQNITVEEFNKTRDTHLTVPTRSHHVKPSEDFSFDFSINEAQRMPISPVDKFTFNEPKYYSIHDHEDRRESRVEERYLDASTSASSIDDDEDLIRIVNAFSNPDMDQAQKQTPEFEGLSDLRTDDEGSFIVHHRKADSRDDESSAYSAKIGNNHTNIRSSLFNNNSNANNSSALIRDDTQDLISRFNLTPDKKKRKTNLRSLIINNELLLQKQQQRLEGKDKTDSKFIRLSIYEDPEDSTTSVATTVIDENIQELDHESLERISISNELIDMNYYDRKNSTEAKHNSLITKFVTKPLIDTSNGGNLSPIIETFNEDAKTSSSAHVSRRKSVRIKNFFTGGNSGNADTKASNYKNIFRPKRAAPKAPSYSTYDFGEAIAEDEKKKKRKNISRQKGKKRKGSTAKGTSNHGTDFFKKLLQFF